MAPSGSPRLGTVLSVWAHPDDEAWLASGLMAHAVRDGGRVVCVTATRGEGGSVDEERWPTETLGGIRELELMACLRRLGVEEHEFLDLPDIDMTTPLPETHGPARIRQLMAEVQPDTVLTFGLEGMTGHEAHKSVSRWTTDAFHAAARPRARLYHARHTTAWAKQFLARLDQLGVFLPGTPVLAEEAALDLVFAHPDDLLDVKLAALTEHTSQLEAIRQVYSPTELRDGAAKETFDLVAVKQ